MVINKLSANERRTYEQLVKEFSLRSHPLTLVEIPRREFYIDNLAEIKIIERYLPKDKSNKTSKKLQVIPKTLQALFNAKKQIRPNEQLRIYSGFRSPDILAALWSDRLKDTEQRFSHLSEKEKFKFASRYTAAPNHPGLPPHYRGDSVDIGLMRDGKEVLYSLNNSDYDQIAYNFFENNPTYQDFHSERKYLRQIMVDVGFIPYDREYWHFGLTPVFPKETKVEND